MSFLTNSRIEERNQGLEDLNILKKYKNKVLIIHYSCESFLNKDLRTPRITSICIKNRAENTTKTFSIHLQAQFKNKELCYSCISESDFNLLEKDMLKEFYTYLYKHKQHYWVHWNMSNSSYGFEAIANRFKILRGNPKEIAQNHTYDLKNMIKKIYTNQFIDDKPDGKIINLACKNKISTKDALKGEDEAIAFDDKNYLKLQLSNSRKVEILDKILDLLEKEELKVNTSILKIYGLSLKGIKEIIKNSTILLILLPIIGYVIGAALEPVIQDIFGTSSK